MALAKATTKDVWFRNLLHVVGFSQSSPITIHCDSQNAIALSENPKYHSRSKPMETQYHFSRKRVFDKQIQLKYVFTLDMNVDIFTKSLPRDKHFQCIENLGMCLIFQRKNLPFNIKL